MPFHAFPRVSFFLLFFHVTTYLEPFSCFAMFPSFVLFLVSTDSSLFSVADEGTPPSSARSSRWPLLKSKSGFKFFNKYFFRASARDMTAISLIVFRWSLQAADNHAVEVSIYSVFHFCLVFKFISNQLQSKHSWPLAGLCVMDKLHTFPMKLTNVMILC